MDTNRKVRPGCLWGLLFFFCCLTDDTEGFPKFPNDRETGPTEQV